MNRIITTMLAAIIMLLGITHTTQAQSCPANSCSLSFSASVSIASTLSCSVTRSSMDFGNHFRGEGHIGSTEANALRARCVLDPSVGTIDVSWTLPTVLSDGAGHTVPISFGTESLRIYDADGSVGTVQGSNPSVPRSFNVTSGFATIALGENGPNDPAGEVSVNLAAMQRQQARIAASSLPP
jgi:hypothetical protein